MSFDPKYLNQIRDPRREEASDVLAYLWEHKSLGPAFNDAIEDYYATGGGAEAELIQAIDSLYHQAKESMEQERQDRLEPGMYGYRSRA